MLLFLDVVVYPLLWPLLVGWVRSSRLWSTNHLLRPSGQQCSHSGGVYPQIQWWQCGAYVGAVEEMMCVSVCECHRGGIVVMDVFWCRLCVNKIWGRMIFCSELGKGVMSVAGKYLFRTANVWWMCAQYFVIASCGKCLETIDVCIWRMFVFRSVVVIVKGVWECLLCSGRC